MAEANINPFEEFLYFCGSCRNASEETKKIFTFDFLPGQGFICTRCGGKFNHGFKTKKINPSEEGFSYICNSCKKENKEMVGNIAFVVSPGSCYACTQCGVVFEAEYKREQIISSNNTSHRSEESDKTFQRSKQLMHHSYKQSHQWPHRCSFCQKGFAHRSEFERHKTQRNTVHKICCNKCSNYFLGKICFNMRYDAYCEKCSDGSSPVEYVAS
ncbi:hypothetical protein TNIN_368601 [Trichonephila inaurata madagascariensis]|uniref:C2H2-type domain-containing protein n=1 Tax=Trichonephila inaurata madagascariensis TaxID=2747483 RepID=A0A8X6YUN9_9ARAC|nr:hypothetical protein TNIN_368601 [Trichonephila inaurata madagascariensis]